MDHFAIRTRAALGPALAANKAVKLILILLCLILGPPGAVSAAVTVSSATPGTVGSFQTTGSVGFITVGGSNKLLLVGVSMQQITAGVEQVTAVDYFPVASGGTAEPLTRAGFIEDNQGGFPKRVEIWYRLAPTAATGVGRVDLTFAPNSGAGAVVGVLNLTDVDQTTPVTLPITTGSGINVQPSIIVPSVASGGMAFDVVASTGFTSDPMASGAGDVQQWSARVSGSVEGGGSTEAFSGSTSIQLDWSIASQNLGWVIAGVAVNPSLAPTLGCALAGFSTQLTNQVPLPNISDTLAGMRIEATAPPGPPTGEEWNEDHCAGGDLYKVGNTTGTPSEQAVDPRVIRGTWTTFGTDENSVVRYNYTGIGTPYDWTLWTDGSGGLCWEDSSNNVVATDPAPIGAAGTPCN